MTASTRGLVGSLAAAAVMMIVACGDRGDVFVGADCPHGFCDEPPAAFGNGDAGDTDVSLPEPTILACIGTECPAPYGTCSDTERCAVDFRNDRLNCGGCGIACPAVLDLQMISLCVDGVCTYKCYDGAAQRDCNGILEDGCEVRIFEDPNNCGACGNECPAGTPCIDGQCGCVAPMVPCNGECVDVRSDVKNCGVCENACGAHVPAPDECAPPPPHTSWGCAQGTCNRQICQPGWGDCDGNAAICGSNGCETDMTTAENCGGCGVTCKPDQECREVFASFECVDKCEKSGRVRCNDIDCTDLATDVDNCGACKAACRGARANQVDRCVKGLCAVECEKGFADCNGDPSDGCEVDLTTNAANCGACGVRCELGVGQPCIGGKCLMVDCETGEMTR